MPRANFIPFNGGIIVCTICCAEWEALGKPRTLAEYHRAIAGDRNIKPILSPKSEV